MVNEYKGHFCLETTRYLKQINNEPARIVRYRSVKESEKKELTLNSKKTETIVISRKKKKTPHKLQ